MRAGFAEVDITPPVGTKKIGWLKEIISDRVLDPLRARVACFESGGNRIAFVQLDTLCVRWTQVNDIRRRIAARYGFPGGNVMVSATHNHSGPAVANVGEVPRDEAYVEKLTANVVEAFSHALSNLQETEIGFGGCFESALAHNRRVVMRDGTVCTHGKFNTPDALYIEGPIDPEVAVVAARSTRGDLLGVLVNFACHPTHYGDSTAFTAGFPGVLARLMADRGCPVTMFLNGASGNVHTANPTTGGDTSMEEAGRILADDAVKAMRGMEFLGELTLGAASRTVELPFRRITDDELRGTTRGAQRFVDPTIYDRGMAPLVERIKQQGTQKAEVQALMMGEYVVVGIPAEYFVEHGLRIKQQSHPQHTLVVSCANGMVGYVPTRQAFERGGYETTFAASSKLAPEAGDLLADCAIELIRGFRE